MDLYIQSTDFLFILSYYLELSFNQFFYLPTFKVYFRIRAISQKKNKSHIFFQISSQKVCFWISRVYQNYVLSLEEIIVFVKCVGK